MSKWQDEITLVSLMPQGKDQDGFVIPPTEVSRLVFCNVISVGQSEFYKAAQAGIKVEAKCEVYTADYEGETICELNGKRYGILRTYSPKNGEKTELTLADLKYLDGGGGNG